MAPLLSCPEISRHRSLLTGPINCISSSTFWRFLSDLLYICNCHGASDSAGCAVEDVFIAAFSSIVDLRDELSIVDLPYPGRVSRPQFCPRIQARQCDAVHTRRAVSGSAVPGVDRCTAPDGTSIILRN